MSEEAQPTAQEQAIQRAWDILTEHLDRVLLVVDWDEENEESGKVENCHQVWWHGGSLSAIGMAEYAKVRLLASGRPANGPDENAS